MMNLNNNQFFKKNKKLTLIFLVLTSVSIRIPIIFIFGDDNLQGEWRQLVNNLIAHGTLSYQKFDDFLLPNLFMPPLYAYYLYLFSFLNLELQSYINVILFSQVFLATSSVIIFYEINKIFFSQKISFYSSIVFSFFPIHVYACSQISSISLQTFFLLLFFYLFFQLSKKADFLSILIFSFVSGLLILLRGEFIVILFFSIFYLFIFFKIKLKNIILIMLISIITISPYLTRNILTFDKITITKSFGFNLWKGNNINSGVEGSEFMDETLKEKVNSVYKDKFFRINLDKIYMKEAIDNIKNDQEKYLISYFKKILAFLFIDNNSTQPNYYNPFHYLPLLLIGVTSLLGIILSDKKSTKMNYLILIFLLNVLIFSSFFILPRYKLSILPLQLIFTNILINNIKSYFTK